MRDLTLCHCTEGLENQLETELQLMQDQETENPQPSVTLAKQLQTFRQTSEGPEVVLGKLFPTMKRHKQLSLFKCPFLCLASPLEQVIHTLVDNTGG